MRSLLMATFSVLAVILAPGPPGLAADPPPPRLTPITEDPGSVLSETNVIRDAAGMRREGIFMVEAMTSFSTGQLVKYDASVEIIRDPAPNIFGLRGIVGRVTDARLDAFLSGARMEPGVVDAGKAHIGRAATADPYW